MSRRDEEPGLVRSRDAFEKQLQLHIYMFELISCIANDRDVTMTLEDRRRTIDIRNVIMWETEMAAAAQTIREKSEIFLHSNQRWKKFVY